MNKTLQKILKKNGRIRYEVYFLVPFVISQLIMMALPVFTDWFQNIFLTAILPMWITAGIIIWIINSDSIYNGDKKWWAMAVFAACFVVCLSDGAIGLLSTIGVISTILGFLAVLIAFIITKIKKSQQKPSKKQ